MGSFLKLHFSAASIASPELSRQVQVPQGRALPRWKEEGKLYRSVVLHFPVKPRPCELIRGKEFLIEKENQGRYWKVLISKWKGLIAKLDFSVAKSPHPNYLGKYKSHRGVPYPVGKRRASSTGPLYFTFLSSQGLAN